MAENERVDASLPTIETAEPRRASTPVSPPPPLSIVHLLLFVACCAIYLAAVRKLILADSTPLGLAIVGIYGMCIAGAWFMLSVFAARCVRSKRWPIEPGLWLGAALGVRLALEILLTLPARPLFQSTEAVLDAVTCLCLVTPLFGHDVPARWKAIVTLLIFAYGFPLLIMGILDLPANLLRYGRPVIVIVLVGAGAVLDRRGGTRRTWLHKLGLCMWVAYALFTIALRLLG